MTDYVRAIAGLGIFVISGMLVFSGNIEEALYLALPTVAFFIGERNGVVKASKS